MRFALDEDHAAFAEAVGDVLAKSCPPEVVRAAWPAPDRDDRPGQGAGAGARSGSDAVEALWQSLAGMGLSGLLVPESAGGLGADEVAAVAVLEEVGYAAVPLPVAETVAVAAPLLAEAGRSEELSQVLSGRRRATASTSVDDGLVPWLGGAGEDETIAVGLVQQGGGEWAARWLAGRGEPVASVDGARRLRRLSLASGDELGPADRELERGVLAMAAQLVGLSRRMLDLTVAYVGERRQFGVPVGSFQAVKHHLADARLRLEFTRPAVLAAAWALATGQATASRDVSTAKALASDTARLVAAKALQCHGATGYTVEYDLHLYLKRAHAVARSWGDAAWHRRRVARALGV